MAVYLGPCECGEDECPNTPFYNSPCTIINRFDRADILIVKLFDGREIFCSTKHVKEEDK
jgi:hypothetical protein